MYPDTGVLWLGTRTEVDDALEQHTVRSVELGEINAARDGAPVRRSAVPLEGGVAAHDVGGERASIAAGSEKRSVRVPWDEPPHHVTQDIQNIELDLARVREVEPDTGSVLSGLRIRERVGKV